MDDKNKKINDLVEDILTKTKGVKYSEYLEEDPENEKYLLASLLLYCGGNVRKVCDLLDKNSFYQNVSALYSLPDDDPAKQEYEKFNKLMLKNQQYVYNNLNVKIKSYLGVKVNK